MNAKLLLLSAMFLPLACRSTVDTEQHKQKEGVDRSLHLEIQYVQSYKVDLTKGIYTVLFMNKPPLHIYFKLSDAERTGIIDKYYSLSIDKLNEVDQITGNVYIEDNCQTMPKTYTFLTVRGDSIYQQIQIDAGCEDFKDHERGNAKRMKVFLDYVYKMIQSKPEVKNSPPSDILYM
jgi:hypothetical protein